MRKLERPWLKVPKPVMLPEPETCAFSLVPSASAVAWERQPSATFNPLVLNFNKRQIISLSLWGMGKALSLNRPHIGDHLTVTKVRVSQSYDAFAFLPHRESTLLCGTADRFSRVCGTCILPSLYTHSAKTATDDMLFNLTVFSPDPHGESLVIDARVWCSPSGVLSTAGTALAKKVRMREYGQCDLTLIFLGDLVNSRG